MIRMLLPCVMAGLLLWALPAFPQTPVLVCYPGGPVKAGDANGAMESMLRVIERVGGWKASTFSSQFTAKAKECKQLIQDKKPVFSFTSLGLYLELRSQHHLTPVVQPRIKGSAVERYRVVVTKGKYKTIDELKGKKVGGTVLEEPQFLHKIVFQGKLDPQASFVLKPSRQALRALRGLPKGDLDAVIINEQQFQSLGSLPFAKDLEVVFTSEPIPLMGVVANTQASSPEERARIAKALTGMCADAEGKKLCDLFGVESFAPVDDQTYDSMVKLWGTH